MIQSFFKRSKSNFQNKMEKLLIWLKIRKPSRSKTILNLPDDCLLKIFKSLNAVDLYNVAMVDKRFSLIARGALKSANVRGNYVLIPAKLTKMEDIQNYYRIFGDSIIKLEIR